jgi:hypothetical protein
MEVRSTLRSGHRQALAACPFRANRVVFSVRRRLPVYPGEQTSSEPVGMSEKCQKQAVLNHSITSLAIASKVWGTVRPKAFAVLRLIANSYLVGACTGRSAGFSPLRMRST